MNTVLNTLIAILLFFMICIFALDFTIPYPKWMIIYFQMPAVKILVYMVLYFTAYYNPVISLLLMIGALMLHINEVFIISINNKKPENAG